MTAFLTCFLQHPTSYVLVSCTIASFAQGLREELVSESFTTEGPLALALIMSQPLEGTKTVQGCEVQAPSAALALCRKLGRSHDRQAS